MDVTILQIYRFGSGLWTLLLPHLIVGPRRSVVLLRAAWLFGAFFVWSDALSGK